MWGIKLIDADNSIVLSEGRGELVNGKMSQIYGDLKMF